MCEMEIWMEKHQLKTFNDISNRKEEPKNKVSEHKVWWQSQMQTYQQGGWVQLEKLLKDKGVMHDLKVYWSHVHAHLNHKAMGWKKRAPSYIPWKC